MNYLRDTQWTSVLHYVCQNEDISTDIITAFMEVGGSLKYSFNNEIDFKLICEGVVYLMEILEMHSNQLKRRNICKPGSRENSG